MGDIKLFRVASSKIDELVGTTDTIEKSLQVFFERNLEALLGVRFLASEYTTTNGRIDSLGLDENGCPVILEYKRSSNENVINQGLFYLDWLLDHRKDFQWLVMERLGKDEAAEIDWSAPRLICVAGDFNRYDEHAVKQIQRNIELIRYRRFGSDIFMLDLVAVTSGRANGMTAEARGSTAKEPGTAAKGKTINVVMKELDAAMVDRYEALRAYLLALGDDVQETMLQFYIAFKRIKNFACVEFRPSSSKILVFVKVDPSEVMLEPGFTRDVSDIGHFGTGDLEITLTTPDDLERVKALIKRSYDAS
jgi:predicted transport protein